MLDFRIATFLQLCETRSYTKTAKLLDITQPSVTQHIKYLQKKYNCKLFTYEGKTLHLTPEGEYFRRQAETMTKMSAKVIADLQRISEQLTELRFGFPREFGERTAAGIVTNLMADQNLHILLETGSTEELLRKLENGQLDAVLCDKYCALPQLASVPAVKVRFGCYAATEYAATAPSFRRILARTLLLQEDGAGDRAVLSHLLQKKGMSFSDFETVTCSNSTAVLQKMAASDLGILFGYAPAMEQEGLAAISFADMTEDRPLLFQYRKDGIETEDCRRFFEAFRTAWTERFAGSPV
ncbi:MAG: LysR family transcriptional regulator [Oscillospiraceae bacterium]|nr:LysR family transcriptional regulator [Oscillospiraceae bacterium]